MQYEGYTIQYTSTGCIVRDTQGRYLCLCDNDSEAYEYIDDLLSTNVDHADDCVYYVCRVPRKDINKYSNYQYYDGRMFKYNLANIKYMSQSQAEYIAKRYTKKDGDYCVYYVKHKSEK